MPAEPRHKSRKHQIRATELGRGGAVACTERDAVVSHVSAADVRNGQNQNPEVVSEVLAVSESLSGIESIAVKRNTGGSAGNGKSYKWSQVHRYLSETGKRIATCK